MRQAAIIFADALARELSVSEDDVYELARTRKLPFAVSTSQPPRLFIAAKDLGAWRRVVAEDRAA